MLKGTQKKNLSHPLHLSVYGKGGGGKFNIRGSSKKGGEGDSLKGGRGEV